jgi:hypothetical protein
VLRRAANAEEPLTIVIKQEAGHRRSRVNIRGGNEIFLSLECSILTALCHIGIDRA